MKLKCLLMKQNLLPVKIIKALAAVVQHKIDGSKENTSGMQSLCSLQKKYILTWSIHYLKLIPIH